MANETWHYLENQFDSVTKLNRKLMDAILKDHYSKLSGAAVADVRLQPLLASLSPVKAAWDAKYGEWKNAQAAYRSASQAVQNLFDTLQIKPVGGGRSTLDGWVSKVASFWPDGNAVYDYLLPRGREPFTSGTIEDMAGEVERLATRLGTKATDLTTLAAAPGNTPEQTADYTEQAGALTALQQKVSAFSTQLNAARNVQTQQEGAVDQLSKQVETARAAAADALYGSLAGLMTIFSTAATRGQVAGFFDLALIMNPPAADDATSTPPATAATPGTPAK
jgi:hypothetical protein